MGARLQVACSAQEQEISSLVDVIGHSPKQTASKGKGKLRKASSTATHTAARSLTTRASAPAQAALSTPPAFTKNIEGLQFEFRGKMYTHAYGPKSEEELGETEFMVDASKLRKSAVVM